MFYDINMKLISLSNSFIGTYFFKKYRGMTKLANYEFMGILKPFLPEDVRAQHIEKIKKLFTKKGGKIDKEDIWGKRHLAYKIKGHEEGYYLLYEIDFPVAEMKSIEEELRMTNDLLRYIIIRKD